MEPVPQNKERLYHACGSEKHKIKDSESKRNVYIIHLKRNQIVKYRPRKELEKYGEVKSMTARQDEHRRKDNIEMACFATEDEAKLAIKMLNKIKQYIANEYKHRKQINNLNNSIQEQDKRYKETVEEKQLQETKTCYVCGSKEYLIKSCKKAPTYSSSMKNG